MDKNAIKKFATWARKELIARVSQKGVEYSMELKGLIREALIKMILGFDIALEIEEE